MEEYNSNFSFNNSLPCNTGCELYIKNICSSGSSFSSQGYKVPNSNGGGKILMNIMSFCELDDLINMKLSCKSCYTSLNKKVIKNFVRQGKITDRVRERFWTANINYYYVQKQVEKSISSIQCFSDSLYEKINISYNEQVSKKTLSNQLISYISVIRKDLSRTVLSCGNDEKTQEKFKMILERILVMTAYIRPEIGYCQGMNFVAQALLTYMEHEEITFWLFITLLDNYELNLLYSKNMPDYAVRLYQMNFYFRKYLPELFFHFKKNEITSDFFFSKWILTIFSSYLPFSTLKFVWDVFLTDRWKSIIKFSLVFLSELQPILLKQEFNGIVKTFKESVRNAHVDTKTILENYSKYKIKRVELDDLKDKYFIEMAKIKLTNMKSVWESDQQEALKLYKKERDSIDKLIKKQLQLSQKKMVDMEKVYLVDEKKYQEQCLVCDTYKNRLEEIVESNEAYNSTLYVLNKELESEQLKARLKSMSTSGSSPRKSPPKKSTSLDTKTNSIAVSSPGSIEGEITQIKGKKDALNKELTSISDYLNESYKLLDKLKYKLELSLKEKLKAKETLTHLLAVYEEKEYNLLKNLADRLKLSDKFVNTSQF